MHMMHQRTVMTVPHSCYAKSNLSPPVPLRVALDKPFCDVSQATLDSCPVSCAPIFGAYHYPSVINMLYLHVCEACRSSLSPLPTILLFSSQFLTSPLCLSRTRSLAGSKLAIRLAAFSPCFKNKSRSSMSLNAAIRSGSTQL